MLKVVERSHSTLRFTSRSKSRRVESKAAAAAATAAIGVYIVGNLRLRSATKKYIHKTTMDLWSVYDT